MRNSHPSKLHPIRSLLLAAVAVSFAFCAPAAIACTIPVFRYALERWESDRLLLVVYYDGFLSVQDDAWLNRVEQQSSLVGGPLNIDILRYNIVSPPDGAWSELKPPPADRPLPWAELRARVRSGTAVCWRGPLAEVTTTKNFFDSPARREIVKRTLAGDSCVWLLVAPQDQLSALSEKLQTMLDSSTKELTIPAGVGLPGSELYASIPLQIRFSVLPLAHDEPTEQVLLTMVSAAAPSWNKEAAYVVPVFGRGRALEVIPLAEVDDFVCQDVGGFLCAACSCRVKEANPGFDLLTSVTWNDRLFGQSERPEEIEHSAPPATLATNSATEPVYLTIPAGTESLDQPPVFANSGSHPTAATVLNTSRFIATLLLLAGGVFLCLIWFRK